MITFQPLCHHRSVAQSITLGLCRRNILGERNRARQCLTDQAERKVKRSHIKMQAENIGDNVALPVPMVDRGRWTGQGGQSRGTLATS